MRGIYYSEGLNFKNSESLGIEKKVLAQVKSLSNLGEIYLINQSIDDQNLIDRLLFIMPFVKSKREKSREILLKKVTKDTNYIYIRKPSLTINFYKILQTIKSKKKDIRIILEIPTYPFHKEYKGLSKLMVIKSIRCEKKLSSVVDYIVTYSDDDNIWGIPCLKTSNCVDFCKIPQRTRSFKIEPNTIRLTCVANYTYWHGLDRLIKGILKYNGKYKIILNVVGSGNELENLKKLANGSENIIFHGPKSGNELDDIFNFTDIAVDALGRHRSGVYYNSSLKGKEYVARGLPVISAVKTELDYMKDFPYYLSLPADETDININDVEKFYEKIYLHNDVSKISSIIRSRTEEKFDYKYGFENVIKSVICNENERK